MKARLGAKEKPRRIECSIKGEGAWAWTASGAPGGISRSKGASGGLCGGFRRGCLAAATDGGAKEPSSSTRGVGLQFDLGYCCLCVLRRRVPPPGQPASGPLPPGPQPDGHLKWLMRHGSAAGWFPDAALCFDWVP